MVSWLNFIIILFFITLRSLLWIGSYNVVEAKRRLWYFQTGKTSFGNLVLAAHRDSPSLWLEPFDKQNVNQKWEVGWQGSQGEFTMFNYGTEQFLACAGGNERALFLSDSEPVGNAFKFTFGGRERWNAAALQCFMDSGQNIDAKSRHNNGPTMDPVAARGWRHGYQMELTWNKVPAT